MLNVRLGIRGPASRSRQKEWTVSKKLPPRVERVLTKALIEPSIGMTRDLRKDVPPLTAVRRMEAAVVRATDRLGQGAFEMLAYDIIELLKEVPEEDLKVDVPVPTARNDAETAVFAVFDSLDKVFPCGTIALLTMMVGVHQPTYLATRYETSRLRRRIANARGEERAIRLKSFAWHVLENEHVPFLHILLQATWIAEGTKYQSNNSIGDLINQVKQRGLLGPLLWTDAPRVRNASAHRGGWRFDLDQNAVILHDERKPPFQPWTQSFAVREIFDKLREIADMTDTLAAVLHRAIARDFCIPMSMPFIRRSTAEGIVRRVYHASSACERQNEESGLAAAGTEHFA